MRLRAIVLAAAGVLALVVAVWAIWVTLLAPDSNAPRSPTQFAAAPPEATPETRNPFQNPEAPAAWPQASPGHGAGPPPVTSPPTFGTPLTTSAPPGGGSDRDEQHPQQQPEWATPGIGVAPPTPSRSDDRQQYERPQQELSGFPRFPWPPPAPSAQLLLPDGLFRGTSAAATSLADVGDKIVRALRQADYQEFSFYSVPNGFALVARLERMSPDGQPLPADFRYIAPDAAQPFSFSQYIRSLFFAPQGFYRFIAFVVTDQPFVTAAKGIDAAGAQQLLREGANRLPPQFGNRPFTPAHDVSALIYEYRKGSAVGDVSEILPGRLPAATHLERTRIYQFLRTPQ